MIGYCPVMWLSSVRKCVHLFMRTFTASPTRMSGGKEPVDSTETMRTKRAYVITS